MSIAASILSGYSFVILVDINLRIAELPRFRVAGGIFQLPHGWIVPEFLRINQGMIVDATRQAIKIWIIEQVFHALKRGVLERQA